MHRALRQQGSESLASSRHAPGARSAALAESVLRPGRGFAVYGGCLDEYGDVTALAGDCAELGLDGIEVVWGHGDDAGETLPNDLVVGYHLLFFSTWVDFWLGKKEALLDEFVTWEAVKDCYEAETPDELVARFRHDLQRAIDFGAEYVVFHVSEVAMAECFTYDFKYGDEEVIDASIELINEILRGTQFKGALYRFLPLVPDIETEVERFWQAHEHRITGPCTPQPGDLVISASPEFLLHDVCAKRGLSLIASQVDPHTGRTLGPNCSNAEKISRFRELFPSERIERFYSDSHNDDPLAELAEEAFMVKGGKLIPWPQSN